MTLADGAPAKIDFLWRKQWIAVETDGGPFQRTRQSGARDARRDQLLGLAGFEPVRFTDRQVALERGWVEHTLRGPDRAVAAASVPRRWRAIRQSWGAGCVRATAPRRPRR